VAFAGAAVAEEDDGFAGAGVAAGGELADEGGGDGGGDVEVELGESFEAGEVGFVDSAGAAVFGAFVDFSGEDFGQEPEVGELGPLGGFGDPGGLGSDHGQAEVFGGGSDGGESSGVGGGVHRAWRSWS
jgi:hypothetical protein